MSADGCAGCGGVDIREWQDAQMAEHGWYAHIIPHSNGLLDVHSHGAQQNFQIIVPIDPTVTHSVISYFIDRVKGGERFTDGHVDFGAIQNGFKVKLIALEKPDCFRIILPDHNGNLDREKMLGDYAIQYDTCIF